MNFHVLFITFLPIRNIVSLLLNYTNKDILICQVTPNDDSEKITKRQQNVCIYYGGEWPSKLLNTSIGDVTIHPSIQTQLNVCNYLFTLTSSFHKNPRG